MATNQQPAGQQPTGQQPAKNVSSTTNPSSGIQVQRNVGQTPGTWRQTLGTWPSLWSGTPFSLMRRMFEDMDHIFDEFSRTGVSTTKVAGQYWNPEVDVFERDGNLIVRADLPGLKKDDIKLEITNNQLVLQGERKYEHTENRHGLYQAERSYGAFYRVVPLPEGTVIDNAQANYSNGVLEILFALPENKVTTKRLEIQEGGTVASPTRH